MAIAYSYIRFSSVKQAGGDSLRRQTEMAEVYAKKNNLELSDLTFRDLGVSGYDKSNIKSGALSVFFDAVKVGSIEKGSYLLIEQFDRFSRAEILVALNTLMELVRLGIIVVTLMDEKIWDSTSLNDLPNLMLSILLMSRAHEESRAKSVRLSAAWGAKKTKAITNKTIMTSNCPLWLKVLDGRGGFEVLAEKVASIQKVFDLRIAGHGISAITTLANKEKWSAPNKNVDGWHISLVKRLLQNRALLGEYQPHTILNGKRVPEGDPVLGFYPVVIDENIFLRAEAVAERRPRFPGRTDSEHRNFLKSLLFCGCGRTLVRKNKTSSKQVGYARYYCTGRVRGVTNCASESTSAIETAVIWTCLALFNSSVSSGEESKIFRIEIDARESEVLALKTRQGRYLELLENTDTPIPAIASKLNEIGQKMQVAEKNLLLAKSKLADLQEADPAKNPFPVIQNINDDLDTRVKFHENLMRFIEKIVYVAETSSLVFHTKDGRVESVNFGGIS